MKPVNIDIPLGRWSLHLFFVSDLRLVHSKICVADVRREVVLAQFGDSYIARIKAVRKLTGWNLPNAKLWVDAHYPINK